MPMRIFSQRQATRPLSRQTAWGCLTSNLALPGMGSIVAGRVSGYGQLVLSILGMALTLIFSFRFCLWYVANSSRLRNDQTDPLALLGEMWVSLRWPLLGFAVFGCSALWALVTSLSIMREARVEEANANLPPKLED
jgi:hypothetical protein